MSNEVPTALESTRRHFTVLDLFIFITLASVVSYLCAISWYSAQALGFTIGIAVVAGVYIFAKPKLSTAIVLFIIGMILVIAGPSVMGCCILFSLFALVVSFNRKHLASPRMVMCGSMMIVIAMLAFANLYVPQRLVRLREARAAFPVTDISDRLAYESNQQDQETTPVALASHVESAVTRDERWSEEYADWRALDLRRVHSQEHERFVRSIGFGVVRMLPLSTEQLSLPDLPTLAHATEYEDNDLEMWQYYVRSLNDRPIPLASIQLQDASLVHWLGRHDFLLPESIGNVVDSKKVVGFDHHAMHMPVGFYPRGIRPTSDRPQFMEEWKLERMELISLLRFDKPKAYVLDQLPRMDHLSSDDVPTRGLNDFEAKALKRLRTEEDIVIEETGNRVVMLGSLRATQDCADCHSVDRGELLGAFSYSFNRRQNSED